MTSEKEYKKFEFKRKPRKCPVRKSTKIAKWFYGMPAPSEELDKKFAEKKLLIGGCCIRDDNPTWACTECETNFWKQKTSK